MLNVNNIQEKKRENEEIARQLNVIDTWSYSITRTGKMTKNEIDHLHL